MAQKSEEYSVRIELDVPVEQAIDRITGALKEEGFGVLTKIDVRETLKKKLDVDFRDYVILGVCNPKLAHQALETDLGVGLLLPCSVVAYEEEGRTVVCILDPIVMLGIIENPRLEQIAREARAQLTRVAEALRA